MLRQKVSASRWRTRRRDYLGTLRVSSRWSAKWGQPNVGIVIDTGHRNLIGDVAMALRMVAEYLITLHIHDNSGASDEHLLPGRGTVAWSDVIKALRDVKYGGVFMYELPSPEDLPSIRENYEWLMREA